MMKPITAKPAAPRHLFAYGSLRRNSQHFMARVLNGKGSFICEASVCGRLYELGEYPGSIPSDTPRDKIFGELYLLPDSPEFLEILDHFEGFDAHNPDHCEFVRKTTQVTTDSGETVDAWIYWYSGACSEERRIVSGNYSAMA